MTGPDDITRSPGYRQIKQYFNAVCDLPDMGAQRAALVALGADEATLVRVTRMLRHADQVTAFSDPVAQSAARWLDSPLQPGDRLGAWTLARPLGEGGMGRVFLAARSDGHYQQRAAIKLLLGWSGPEALARLTRERQILADLNHRHIVRLLDGGTTPSGQPYLVMEHADGLSIDTWCNQQEASLATRLALFDTVCDAVAHAHRQLVIHCDIKPSNVIVERDGRAVLLDFGIAQLTGQDSDASPAMTPGYASPEQTAGERPGVASDVYSLGRLLSELLRPVAGQHRRAAELAAIVARATGQQANQRYESIAALRRDLQCVLAHRPVLAMNGGSLYVMRKALRRHWPWALASALVLALMSSAVSQLVHERDRAVMAERAALQRLSEQQPQRTAP